MRGVAGRVVVWGVVLAAGSVVAAESVPQAGSGKLRFSPTDWPCWRGPSGTGVATADQQPPLRWSKDENVVWKTAIPGRGHGSPIVVGDQVFVTTADPERDTQSLLCLERGSGKLRWEAVVHSHGLVRKGHQKSTPASATPACDGERVFVNFLNSDAIFTTALDLDGKQLWQTKVSEFATHQGFGSSPTMYGPYLFVSTDSRSGGVIAALERATGKLVWEVRRPEKANYASAMVLQAGGRDQLVVHGCDLIASFEPLSGKSLWEIEGATTECVTSLVTDGERIFVSGGWPRKHVQAVLADGSGKTVWENNVQVYVPSMIVKDGYLYAVQDAGVASCWEGTTGKEAWKQRVGGAFTASLTLVGDHLFATSETGQTSIFKARADKFELVAENQLGDEAFATPAICGGRIYMRVVEKTGEERQEVVYCLGEGAAAK